MMNTPLRFAYLSIVTAVITIALKAGAYVVTGSAALLSDALEAVVNLVAAVFTLIAIVIAARPPDDEHSFGHYKVEYFSSGVEGGLIVVAAVLIVVSVIGRLRDPQPLTELNVGLIIAAIAMVFNFGAARMLRHASVQYRSMALEADAHHLMSDVWTSLGVLVGLGLVRLTGWQWLDSVIALGVALHILLVGWRLVKKSLLGLMDTAWPLEEQQQLTEILEQFGDETLTYHAVRTRISGSLRFVSLHLQVPGHWTVQRGHTLVDRLEEEIRQQLSPVSILIHLEPLEDPASWDDTALFRPKPP